MVRYILVNGIRGILTLLFVSVIVFGLARITGDPMDVLAPIDMAQEDQDALRAEWGLDKPVPEQYVIWLGNALQGDFGPSFLYSSETAGSIIWDRLGPSFKLGIVATLMTLLIGVPLGILSAMMRGSLVDTISRGLAQFGQSVAEFWLAIMLIWLVAVQFPFVPTSGMGGWRNYILPATVIAIAPIAAVLRLFRSSILDTLGTEYIKLARLKGLSQFKVLGKHALKPASIAPMTFFGQLVVRMLTGATVVEIIFSWPGIGLLAYESANARDFPIVQALALYGAAFIVVTNLLIDVGYAVLDPRVRLGEKAST